MTKLNIINSCLEMTGQRQVTVYDSSKPEQLLANNIIENVTYETTSIINDLNPDLITGVGIINDYDTLSALSNVENILNYIKAKSVRNFTNAKTSAQTLSNFAENQLLENTLSLINYLISKGVPTRYLNNTLSELEDLFFEGIFDINNVYVIQKAELDYRIDLYMTFNIENKSQSIANSLNLKVANVDKLFNSTVSKTIDNGAPESLINEVLLELCSKGWYFNTTKNFELIPDSLGFINLSSSILRLDSKNGYIKKSGRLYDPFKQSFIFEKNILVDLVILVDYQDLPEIAKNYVNIKSNRRFINLLSSKLGKDKYRNLIQRYSDKDEESAFIDLKIENNKSAKLNIFNNYYVQRILNKVDIPSSIVNIKN